MDTQGTQDVLSMSNDDWMQAASRDASKDCDTSRRDAFSSSCVGAESAGYVVRFSKQVDWVAQILSEVLDFRARLADCKSEMRKEFHLAFEHAGM